MELPGFVLPLRIETLTVIPLREMNKNFSVLSSERFRILDFSRILPVNNFPDLTFNTLVSNWRAFGDTRVKVRVGLGERSSLLSENPRFPEDIIRKALYLHLLANLLAQDEPYRRKHPNVRNAVMISAEYEGRSTADRNGSLHGNAQRKVPSRFQPIILPSHATDMAVEASCLSC